jgi:hypothetical protein
MGLVKRGINRVSKQKLIIYSAMLALGSGSLVGIPSAYAFDMGDMMSPNKWFGGNKDRYYDDYYYDRYYGGPYGGYGPYGGGWGGPYGYGAPYGYGYPGYGMPYQQQQQSNEPPPPPLPQ